MERRQFLEGSAAMAITTTVLADAPAPALAGKASQLKQVSSDPLVLETPDAQLATSRVTPTDALFVRNHHGAKPFLSMEPLPLSGTLAISGLVRNAESAGLERLASMPRIEVEMVLQCSGNFRSLFAKFAPIKGLQWGKGGIGNVRFAGVPFAAFVKASGIQIEPAVKYVTAEGADQPEKPGQHDYEKSIPLDVALSRGLLALELNGKPLPAVHGGPVRLVVPGYYGSMHVKWLTKLRFDAEESKTFYQATDYRVPTETLQPGQAFQFSAENSVPTADMKINSRIFSPSDGQRFNVGETITARGVAWNDGQSPITTVELTSDGGRTWKPATLAASAGPYAFREWSLPMTLEAGRRDLWVRAKDAAGREQPLDGKPFWNPGGYAWNGVEKITVAVV
jgi:sulfite oxidase